MEALTELINRHRSIRKYKPDPVPEHILMKILQAATRASSSGNMQSYSIIVTKDAEILQCPKNVVPVVSFSLGYADETPPDRGHLPLNGIIHENVYHDYSDSELLDIYKDKETKGFQRYLEIPELRKTVEEMHIKNLAQVYTKAKYTRESHLEYSKSVLACLKEKDFLNL